jgi:hypothetical protein
LLAVTALAVVFAGAWWALRVRAPRATAASPGVPAAAERAPVASGAPAPVAGQRLPLPSDTRPARDAIARPDVRASLTLWRDGDARPLLDGGRIQPGDRLSLAIEATERLHVYVLDEDGQGGITTLFPFAGGGLANPLPAGARSELPGVREGEPLRWLVTSAEGRETFLIVASRQPLATVERAVAALPGVREGEAVRYATLTADDLRHMRGVAGVVADSAHTERAGGHLTTLARSLESARERGTLWFSLVRVDNPAR